MDPLQVKKYLEERGLEYHPDAAVEPYLTMGIGGQVRLIAVIGEYVRLKEFLIYLHRWGCPYVLLGGGSNVIFPDDFSSFAVIINRTNGIERQSGHIIKVNSGVTIGALMEWNIRGSIGGMDFLAGIPGTVGGAAAVNAGAFGESISAILEKAEIVTRDGEVKIVANDYFRYTYRNSVFKYGDEVILNVFLRYADAGAGEVKEKVEARLKYRRENHPCTDHRSAGCFFKNPFVGGKKAPAGRLLERLGFKGKEYERLRVSGEHANFIINKGEATFADLEALEGEIVGKAVKERGIKLEREVIYISPQGRKY